jgi:hypothetical protein
LKQAAKNDVSTVEKLFNEIEKSKKMQPPVPTKKAKLNTEELGITAGMRLTHSAAKEKERSMSTAAIKLKTTAVVETQ